MSNWTICFVTNRQICGMDWFADALCRQCPDGNFPQVIIVDSVSWRLDPEMRKIEWANAVKGRFEYTLTTPKPTVWQGPHRLTTQDYFAPSNARNTGILLCKTSYLYFIDDVSVMLPGFLDNVRHAAQHGYIMGGSYKKVFELKVRNGLIESCREHAGGVDSRWSRGSDSGIVPLNGGSLFGCSCGFPIEALLQVGGYDEMCDSQGAEDYSLGIALEKHGYKLFYNRNACTYESEELHGQLPVMKRIIKPGNPDASHVHLNRLLADPRPVANTKYFNIRELRQKILAGEPFPIPTEPSRHWFDSEPLALM